MTMSNPNPEPTTPLNAAELSGGTDQLNRLLRGEISATETYRMVIESISGGSRDADQMALLRQIQESHGRAAQSLRDRIRELGGEASDTSGAWGAWARLAQGAANLFGDAAALKSLKEGEEQGLREYERTIDELDATSAGLIRNQLVPQQQRHLHLLQQLIHAEGRA
jgi:TolA-binding protein